MYDLIFLFKYVRYLSFIPVQHCTDDTQNCNKNLSQLKFSRLKPGNVRRYCWVGTSLTHPDGSTLKLLHVQWEMTQTSVKIKLVWHSFCPQYRRDICQERGLACAVPYPAKEMISREALLGIGQIWSRVSAVTGMNNHFVHSSNFVISVLTSVYSLNLIYQFKFFLHLQNLASLLDFIFHAFLLLLITRQAVYIS